MIPAFRRVRSTDDDIRQVQDAVDAVFRVITPKAILDGQLISNVVIDGGTPRTIDHGLGRALVGWMVTRKDAETDVWDSQSDNGLPSQTLVLNATADVTLSLWVF